MKIYLSGVHSGPNPSPGVGTARSLRAAYPDATIVAVDYSNESSGIHHGVFDDVVLFRPWDELDLDAHAKQIERLLAEGDGWISGLDLEVGWLAGELDSVDSMLVPSRAAFDRTRKPDVPAADDLPVRIPEAIGAFEERTAVERFCRRNDWNVWVKGPHYEAESASNWEEVVRARRELSETWATEDVVVQSHVEGEEVAIAVAAHEGELVGSTFMEKRVLTESGKTWSGSLEPVREALRDDLEEVMDSVNWTGGCELEFVRDRNGRLNLIDWNPRFPAWIHGATIAGANLPADLVEAATGRTPNEVDARSSGFARIVEERPVRGSHPLPVSETQDTEGSDPDLKHPSGMPLLAHRAFEVPGKERSPDPVGGTVRDDLSDVDLAASESPRRVAMERSTEEAFSRARDLHDTTVRSDATLRLAYSVKTNPDRRLLEAALQNDLLAEVITGEELDWALAVGFDPSEIVVNGPVGIRDLLESDVGPVAAVFADSLPALGELVDEPKPPAETVGVRIRPPDEPSRFGIPLDEPDAFSEVVALLGELPNEASIGFHLHVQSNRVGIHRWQELAETLVAWAETTSELTGVPVETLDFGGGWTPDDFRECLPEQVTSVLETAETELAALEQVVLEPGKALARPSAALLTRVVETRERPDGSRDVVMDASTSDLPLAGDRPHPVLARLDGRWHRLPVGGDRFLGRMCVERDVIADGVHVPHELAAGDLIAFLGAGGYDASMSYEFGAGGG